MLLGRTDRCHRETKRAGDVTYVVVFCLGLFTAVAWVWYIRAAVKGHPWRAAAADAMVMLPPYIAYQLWAIRDHDFKVFLCMLTGSLVGTWWRAR